MKPHLTKSLLVATTLAAGFTATTFTATTAAAQSDDASCGDVQIAEMNWASAGVGAWVDKIILEAAFDCDVTLVTGDTMPTFTSMNEKGEPDVAPELWVNAVKNALDQAVAEDRMHIGAPLLSEGGVEGWWIPKYMQDAHPEIQTVEDALARPDLFPAPEDPSRGGVYNCPAGWNCQISTENLYRAYGAEEKGFDLVDSGSAAGLDGSISNAYEREAGWLGYYWAPTSILGKYEMVKLDAGVPLDKDNWDACTSQANCADPVPNSYPVSDVFTVVTKDFAETNAVTMDYFNTRQWDNATVNQLLAWKDENQATNEDAAWHFFETSEMWKDWLTEEQVARVEDEI